MYSFLEIRN